MEEWGDGESMLERELPPSSAQSDGSAPQYVDELRYAYHSNAAHTQGNDQISIAKEIVVVGNQIVRLADDSSLAENIVVTITAPATLAGDGNTTAARVKQLEQTRDLARSHAVTRAHSRAGEDFTQFGAQLRCIDQAEVAVA